MERLEEIYRRIDAANAEDPRQVDVDGKPVSQELIYGIRMSQRLGSFEPEATEALKIAARGQHLRRWEIPREQFPMDRSGYLRWRTCLYGFHADQIEAIMISADCPEEMISRVRQLLSKRSIKSDPEAQALEDVICLVFLEHYFEAFIARHPKSKVIEIVRKTWGKMSEKGHEHALSLQLAPLAAGLVSEALSG